MENFDLEQGYLKSNHKNSSPINSEGIKILSRNKIEDSVGRNFYGGPYFKAGPNQMLLARILKGIMPISDVVYIKNSENEGYFYSYEIPIGTEKTEFESFKEGQVCVFILRYVFGDDDHIVSRDNGEYCNTVNENGDISIFDFHYFKNFWSFSDIDIRLLKLHLLNLDLNKNDLLINKLDVLLKHISGEAGFRFLSNIVNSILKINDTNLTVINEAPGEDKIFAFQQEIIRRINLIKDVLNTN
jgi:hypothetical protein